MIFLSGQQEIDGEIPLFLLKNLNESKEVHDNSVPDVLDYKIDYDENLNRWVEYGMCQTTLPWRFRVLRFVPLHESYKLLVDVPPIICCFQVLCTSELCVRSFWYSGYNSAHEFLPKVYKIAGNWKEQQRNICLFAHHRWLLQRGP